MKNELSGFPERWANFGPFRSPPARRTCDAALDAILALRATDLAKAYEEAGWTLKAHTAIGRLEIVAGGNGESPSRGSQTQEEVDGERGRWLDALRDRMIAKLRKELGK